MLGFPPNCKLTTHAFYPERPECPIGYRGAAVSALLTSQLGARALLCLSPKSKHENLSYLDIFLCKAHGVVWAITTIERIGTGIEPATTPLALLQASDRIRTCTPTTHGITPIWLYNKDRVSLKQTRDCNVQARH